MIGIILDTDVFSDLTNPGLQASRFAPYVEGVDAALAFPSVAEVHFGAARAGWGQARRSELHEAIGRYGVVPFVDDLPRLWGELRADAARTGHPLGQKEHANDLWIAACARYYGVPLLTGNVRHFAELPGLDVVEVR